MHSGNAGGERIAAFLFDEQFQVSEFLSVALKG